MKKFRYLILLLFIVIIFLYFYHKDLKDDFYDTINHQFLSHNYLEDDKNSYSNFSLAQDKADKEVDRILDGILKHQYDMDNDIRNSIELVYHNALDIDKRDGNGLGELNLYLKDILSVQNIDEFIHMGIKIENDLKVPIFTNITIHNDYKDNTKNIVYFYPMTLAFSSSSFIYVDEDYMAYKAYIKRGIIQLLKLYGYSKKEASTIANDLIGFYEELGNHSYSNEYYDDISHYYHIVSLDEVSSIYSNIDMNCYLMDKIGEYSGSYSLVDDGQMRFLNHYLTNDHLENLKYYAFVQVLSQYASVLDSNYMEVVLSLNHSLGGERKSIDELSLDMVLDMYSSTIGNILNSTVVHKKNSKEIEDMFLRIKDAFGIMLQNNQWLQDNTKKEALLKLKNMKLVIGMEEFREDIVVSGDTYLSNIISYQQEMWKREVDRLYDGGKENAVSESVVNAYYQPLDNSVHIPSAFFYLEDDIKSDKYFRLGYLGMIIAHEVTHGFDANGSLFDKNGNYYNWWTEEDREQFLSLCDDVSRYYDQFEVIGGRYINGKKTVNENVADLGAMRVLVTILESDKANGNDYREMFSGFANLWASEESEQYQKLLLLVDHHSPNKYRVNAVLSSTDQFYSVYHIYPWNGMYQKDRVGIW